VLAAARITKHTLKTMAIATRTPLVLTPKS
jgi:hypothetical protein